MQVLWLFGEERQVTEVGSMNICFVFRSKDGSAVELVTAPLDRGDILPGVTRRSVLELAREWIEMKEDKKLTPNGLPLKVAERWVTMGEIIEAKKEGRLLEVFGCGTAALLCPVESIVFEEHEIMIPVPSLSADSKSLVSAISREIYDIQVRPVILFCHLLF